MPDHAVASHEPAGDDSRALCAAVDLRRFVAEVLRHYGVDDGAAEAAAECLIDADLCGVETHGISNLVWHEHYARGLSSGAVNPRPAVEVIADNGSTVVLDGHGGFGPLVANEAMDRAISAASKNGVATVTVRNGCHFGAAGYFAARAADAAMIGLVMCPTTASTIAPGGLDRLVGSNPIAFAAPTGGGHPFVFDMSSTVAAGTKLVTARRDGLSIPPGWAVGPDGELTTDPHVAQAGATVPLGYLEGAGHKGFGLALMVDILAGVLAGSAVSAFAEYGPDWRQGYFMTVWDVGHFLPIAQFNNCIGELFDHIRGSRSRSADDPVTLPGDHRAALRARHERFGVPVNRSVLEQCDRLAEDIAIRPLRRWTADRPPTAP